MPSILDSYYDGMYPDSSSKEETSPPQRPINREREEVDDEDEPWTPGANVTPSSFRR